MSRWPTITSTTPVHLINRAMGHRGRIFRCTERLADCSFLVAGISHHNSSRPAAAQCIRRTARCAEVQGAECSVQSAVACSAVCSLQSDSFVQCEMRNEGNRKIRRPPCLYAGLVHLPSNQIARYLHSPHPVWRGSSLSAHRFGADAMMVRIEWIKRLSRGCRSARVVDQIQHSSSALLFIVRTCRAQNSSNRTVSQELHLVPKWNASGSNWPEK